MFKQDHFGCRAENYLRRGSRESDWNMSSLSQTEGSALHTSDNSRGEAHCQLLATSARRATGCADAVNVWNHRERVIKNGSKFGSLQSQKGKLPLIFGQKRFRYDKFDILIRHSSAFVV